MDQKTLLTAVTALVLLRIGVYAALPRRKPQAGASLFAPAVWKTVARSLKIFLNRRVFRHNHDYRRAWQDLTARLASCTTTAEIEKAIPSAYCELFDLRSASLYFFDRVSGRFLPALPDPAGSSVAGFRPSPALISYFCERNRVWNPFEAEYLPEDEEASFARATGARVVVPLVSNRKAEGLVVFGEQADPVPFMHEDYDLMKIVARQSGLLLANLRLSEELIEARELAAMVRLSSFVLHDLKNHTYTLALMTGNAEEHIENGEFQRDLIVTIRNTVDKMKQLMQKLKGLPEGGRSRMDCHDIRDLSAEVVEEFRKIQPGADVLFRGESAHAAFDPGELRKVIANLVQNGIEASGGHGTVIVETEMENESACVRISDAGCGMTGDFMRHDLFKPFRTTKKTGLGIGVYHSQKIVETLGGTIEVRSEKGKGTAFTVRLPLAGRKLSCVR